MLQQTSEQDAYGIVLSQFSELPAGQELAKMALHFHFAVQVSTCPVAGFNIQVKGIVCQSNVTASMLYSDIFGKSCLSSFLNPVSNKEGQALHHKLTFNI